MADCWQPSTPLSPGWADADDCGPTNRWLPGLGSSSIACEAVACLAVACEPQEPAMWSDTPDSGVACVAGLGAATDTGFDKGYQ